MALVIDQTDAATDTGAAVVAVRRMLGGVRREARKWIWVESIAWLVVAATAVFWCSLAFDWSVEPPAWVRGMVGGVALGGMGWIIATKLVARLGVPLADESLAIAVERGHPGFRDSLSTTIALATADRAGIDGRLFARTAAEAAALLGDVDAARIFRRRRLVSLALLAALAAATVGLLVAARPAIGMIWARRMLRLSAEPWPRRVSLDAEGFRDGIRTVARGSDVELVVHARGSDGPPADVDVRTRGPGGWTTARMGTRGAAVEGVQTFVHVIKGVAGDVALEIRGGDARLRDLRMHAVDPPAVESIDIRCVLPAYLGGGVRKLPAARTVPIPRGSRVEIECTATKPLRSARLVQRSSTGPASRPLSTAPVNADGSADGSAPDAPLATLDPAPPGTRAISGTLGEVLADTAVLVRLEDSDGLANRDGVAFTLVAVADEAPRVGLRLVGGATALTPRGRVMVEGSISDDHGLAAAAIVLRSATAASRQSPRGAGNPPPRAVDGGPAGAGAGAEGPRASLAIDRVRGGETVIDIDANDPLAVSIDPLRLVAGGRLLVSVEARDGCTLAGGPNIGTSDTWTLDIVTPDELRALLEAREILLRRRFEGAIDDLTRARERLGGPQANGDEQAVSAVARCGEAATRAGGETGEIAAAFRGIGLELANNALLSPELDARLVAGIARPLARIAAEDLPDLAKACRQAAGGPVPDPAAVAREADAVIARMRGVLAKMLEAESINEIIERLRGVLRAQEQIRAETIETQKRQAREALERP